MLGLSHSEFTKNILRSHNLGSNNPRYGKPGSLSRGISSYYKDYCFKSRYESIYAVWLLYNKINFKYEYLTFDYVDEDHTYTPDFYLLDYNKIVEIKGYYTDKLLRCEEIVLANGYEWELIIGSQIWKYYDELIYAGVNIDELYYFSGKRWLFINNKIIMED